MLKGASFEAVDYVYSLLSALVDSKCSPFCMAEVKGANLSCTDTGNFVFRYCINIEGIVKSIQTLESQTCSLIKRTGIELAKYLVAAMLI